MLRILKKTNGDVVFALSGRIDKENIAELEDSHRRGRESPPHHS